MITKLLSYTKAFIQAYLHCLASSTSALILKRMVGKLKVIEKHISRFIPSDYWFLAGIIMIVPYTFIGATMVFFGYGWWAVLPFVMAVVCFYHAWAKFPELGGTDA